MRNRLRQHIARVALGCATLLCAEPAVAQFVGQGPKLVGSGAVGPFVEQGTSVALSADGNTALVGGPSDNGIVGAVWVWSRSVDVWTEQGQKLVGAGAVGNAGQGQSVALSADGNTALVGGPSDNGMVGAAWVWTRSGDVWTQQGPKLVGADAVGNARQGWAVALSADGNTALVGGRSDNSGVGATWVWTRSGGVWTQQGPKLVGSGAVGPSVAQGTSVSLSADGNTALVGGPSDNGIAGAAWVWTRSGDVWTEQGQKLVGAGAVGNARQGQSVALAADGNTAFIGGNGDNSGAGATWVWTRSGGVWTQQGPKLVGSGAVGNAGQGWFVALSADGDTALVGGRSDNSGAGATWVWTRSGGVWTQQGPKLVGWWDAVGTAGQGFSVALSADGNTAFVGGPDDDHRTGATWVFVEPVPYLREVAPNSGQQGQSGLYVHLTGEFTNFVQGTTTASFGAGITVYTTVENARQATAFLTIDATAPTGPRTVTVTTGLEVVQLANGFTVTPGPTITRVAPNSGYQGQENLNVVITGAGTHFVAGSPFGGTYASFGAGVTVNNTTVQSATQVTANVTIAAAAATGPRTVTVSTDTSGGFPPHTHEEVVALAAFTVTTGGPSLTLVSPNAGARTQANLIVTLSGQLTHFVQGQSTASFGAGTIVNSTTVQSATQAIADVTIEANASFGPRTVTITTGGEVAALADAFMVTPLTFTAGDADGDGKADIAVFRPSNGTWYIRYSATPTAAEVLWGGGSDLIAPGDYDGDKRADIAVFRPSTGTWYIRYTATPTASDVVWGGGSDIPVPADYDGDGKTDIAVFRPSTGIWYIRSTAIPTLFDVVWGGGSDIPVPADYDGDGKTDIAVFRPSSGIWYIRYTATPTAADVVWGGGSDIPVPADYDGDGKADIAVFRPSSGIWYIRYTATPTASALVWGGGSDIRVPGDYDADGKTDIAVFRPSTGTWYLRYTGTPTALDVVWGGESDIPVLKR